MTVQPGHDLTDASPPSWGDAIAALRLYRETHGSADVPTQTRIGGIGLGKWVAQCQDDYWDGQLNIDAVRQLEAIAGWHWGPARVGSWRHALNLLNEYAAQHGTAVLIDHATVQGVDLQSWATAQRQANLNHELSKPQIQHLQQLPDWDWRMDAVRWRQGLAAAKLYIKRRHSLATVQRHTKLGEFPLGQWLQRCREDYRADTMPPDRAAQLEALPGWTWGRHQQNWTDGLTMLRRYIAETGHASPPQHTVVDGYHIGWWVNQKRSQHRHGTLPARWVETLELLPGWTWEPNEDRWQRGLAALNEYVAAHGHASPTSTETTSGYPIGEWVRTQRNAHQRGRLSSDRAAQLATLPGWCWRTSTNGPRKPSQQPSDQCHRLAHRGGGVELPTTRRGLFDERFLSRPQAKPRRRSRDVRKASRQTRLESGN